MANYTYKITKKFNNFTLLEFYRYFYLAKAKLGEIRQASSVNGVLVYENYKLKTNDLLSFSLTEENDIKPFKKKIEVVYEDDNFLIINKPLDILVHSDGVNTDKTLSNAVRYYYDSKGQNTLVRYCHRLDYSTTGLIIFVKDPLTNSYVNELISHHSVKRDYLAIVSGVMTGTGVIDKKIGKDRHHNSRRRVGNTGLDAITNYTVLKNLKKCSLLKLELTTGRTHQIRVHMKYMGHPLVGDELYGGNMTISKNLMLLSYHLELKNPYTDELIDLTLPLTNDMQRVVDKG